MAIAASNEPNGECGCSVSPVERRQRIVSLGATHWWASCFQVSMITTLPLICFCCFRSYERSGTAAIVKTPSSNGRPAPNRTLPATSSPICLRRRSTTSAQSQRRFITSQSRRHQPTHPPSPPPPPTHRKCRVRMRGQRSRRRGRRKEVTR